MNTIIGLPDRKARKAATTTAIPANCEDRWKLKRRRTTRSLRPIDLTCESATLRPPPTTSSSAFPDRHSFSAPPASCRLPPRRCQTTVVYLPGRRRRRRPCLDGGGSSAASVEERTVPSVRGSCGATFSADGAAPTKSASCVRWKSPHPAARGPSTAGCRRRPSTPFQYRRTRSRCAGLRPPTAAPHCRRFSPCRRGTPASMASLERRCHRSGGWFPTTQSSGRGFPA